MQNPLQEELISTLYIHRPLPLHEENSLEGLGSKKNVVNSRALCPLKNLSGWKHRGPGSMSFAAHSCMPESGCIRLTSPTVMPAWPEGASPDGDYSNFGAVVAAYAVNGENWEAFNRFAFSVFPQCEGIHSVHLTVAFQNEGKVKIPDAFGREGFHVINLKNGQWNRCTVEIPCLPRDRITEISFYFFINGKDVSTGEEMRYDIGAIELQQVDEENISHGWLPAQGSIVCSGSGYSSGGRKTALAAGLSAKRFALVEEQSGKTAFEGDVLPVKTLLGSFDTLDFTNFHTPGSYFIRAGKSVTAPFRIGSDVWEPSVWKSINFLFCERCGGPVPDKHGTCHQDLLAEHNGKTIVYNGGWHDAGDVSQQTLQTAEITCALLEMAQQVKDNRSLYLRLQEEAEWGLDFVLRCRFSDGYRATSAGITIWSQGFIGDMDDMKARVHNNAFENFLCAGIEAFASTALADRMLASRALSCAREDFRFAWERFEKVGFGERPIMWEHSYMTSESLFMAAASWAASALYEATGETEYAKKAAEFIQYVLDCQNTEPVGENTRIGGFFYRDRSHKVIQHFNHQARDHVYMQALTLLCRTQPEHPQSDAWRHAVELYGGYLKSLTAFSKPYGMLPSGVYGAGEAEDTESFYVQHLLVDKSAEKEYLEQLKTGVQLDGTHYVRRFPVWFSFRGNTAVLLSMGKSAAQCGLFLHDRSLMAIAEEQLQWIVGKNPFGQSLMYGEGTRYAQQYAVLPGEMTGELPVGVETLGNEDEPYWPQTNNATYKEVWTSAAGRWLAIVADLYKSGGIGL